MIFYAMILIFNKKIEDSQTYGYLKKKDSVKIIVIDNSTENFGNEIFCQENKITYISSNCNLGISKSYNIVFNYLMNKSDYLFLFDDDSELEENYIKKFCDEALEKSYVDIFVPKVISLESNRVMSPRIWSVFNFEKRIYAINSGILIKSTVLKECKYDEELFLYFCDLKFFMDNQDKKIMYLENVTLYQNFSDDGVLYSDKEINQFQMRIDDAKIFYRKSYNSYLGPIRYYIYVVFFAYTQLLKKKKNILHDLDINFWRTKL